MPRRKDEPACFAHSCSTMTYEAFLQEHQALLYRYYLLQQVLPGKFELPEAYPPGDLDEEDEEDLRRRLVRFAPRDSMLRDLWDWDFHFENDLSSDWFYGATLYASDENDLAGQLSEYFVKKAREYHMDYDLDPWSSEFEQFVEEEALRFIRQWRLAIAQAFKPRLQSG